MAYWRDFVAHYVAAPCASPDGAERAGKPIVPLPSDAELALLAAAAPPMVGAEYLKAAVLADLWRDMDMSCDAELENATVTVQLFLKRRNPAWNLVGHIHFDLAENCKDEEAPFAFLVTYTTKRSSAAKAQNLLLDSAPRTRSRRRVWGIKILIFINKIFQRDPIVALSIGPLADLRQYARPQSMRQTDVNARASSMTRTILSPTLPSRSQGCQPSTLEPQLVVAGREVAGGTVLSQFEIWSS